MRKLAAVTLAALLLGACGDGNGNSDDGGGGAEKPSLERVQQACREGIRDLARPLEVERRLPKSTIPTTTKDRRFIRAAKVLRGYRAVVDRVLRTAREAGAAEFARALQSLSTDLEGAEFAMRYEYNVPVEENLRPLWRKVRTTAASAGLDGCRRLSPPS